jgi:acid phosphatase family membrane protein YuiD
VFQVASVGSFVFPVTQSFGQQNIFHFTMIFALIIFYDVRTLKEAGLNRWFSRA